MPPAPSIFRIKLDLLKKAILKKRNFGIMKFKIPNFLKKMSALTKIQTLLEYELMQWNDVDRSKTVQHIQNHITMMHQLHLGLIKEVQPQFKKCFCKRKTDLPERQTEMVKHLHLLNEWWQDFLNKC